MEKQVIIHIIHWSSASWLEAGSKDYLVALECVIHLLQQIEQALS